MRNLALLFPGQGSQYVGMGKALYERSGIAGRTFEEANDSLGFDLKSMCFEGSMEELSMTENTQPAILTLSVAAFRTYMEELGSQPTFLAGHSLGEISALTCAGAIEFSDAVKIVRQRGRFMQEAAAHGTGAMYAISGMDKNVIEEQCKKNSSVDSMVGISNYNSPGQTVISGHEHGVRRVAEELEARGARIVRLKVSAPFHSPLMEPAAAKLKEELQKYSYNKFNWPIISNVTAQPYHTPEEIVDNLTRQMTSPVQWHMTVDYLKSRGIAAAVELGPQRVLKNLVKGCAKDIVVYSYDEDADVSAMKSALAGGKDGDAGHGFRETLVTKCIAEAICTKNSNWDEEEYRKGVIEPYRRIQKMQGDLEREGKEPTVEQMQEALDMLKSVFTTKKVGMEEQVQRFQHIFDMTATHHLFPDFIIGLS